MPDTEASSTPAGGSAVDLSFLTPDVPPSTEGATEETAQAEESSAEEPVETATDESDATETDQPSEEEESDSGAKHWDIDKFESMTPEQQKEMVKDMAKRSVPYQVFTQKQQEARAAEKEALTRAEQIQSQLEAARAKAEQFDKVLPVLQALQADPELLAKVDQLMGSGSGVAQVAPTQYQQELAAIKAELDTLKASQGNREIERFESDHPELSDDLYLRDSWMETAVHLIKSGVSKDPLNEALELTKLRLEKERGNPKSAVTEKIRANQKKAAAVPSGRAKSEKPVSTSPEDDFVQGILAAGRSGVNKWDWQK